MNAKSLLIRYIVLVLSVSVLLCFVSLKAQVIPQSDRVNWPGAGLWTDPPACADTVFQVNLMSGTTWDDKIENACTQARSWIDSHPSNWAIIYFPAGTYTLTREINLDHSYRNIIFQGAGSNETTLKFDMGGTNQNCFHIFGSDPKTNKRELAADLNKDSNQIQCTQTIDYPTPCWIRLCEEDHPYHDSWAQGSVGQITRLESASGVMGTLKDAASKQYTVSRHTKIWPITPVMNIGIENLKIWRIDDGYATSGGGRNIYFWVAVNCWVKGVRFEQTTRHHIWVELCSHIYISGCYFHDAQHFGDGGYAYGVALAKSTTNCLIENNIFHKLRHAMLVQEGANCNVFVFNYSYEQYWTTVLGKPVGGDSQIFGYGPGGDIDMHGNFPYANLFEHNYCERIVADAAHGENWKYNTIIRNRVTNDHDSDRSWIYLRKAPKTTVLGNMRSAVDASEVEYAYCDMYRDVFGFLGSTGYSHNYFFQGWGDEENAILADVSYYYASRPTFLPASYTWPTIGPKVSSGSGSLSQTIPARARFNQSIKTYLADRVLTPRTASGSLSSDELWTDTHTLTGDVTVPSGITLYIEAGAVINIPSGKKLIIEGTLKAQGVSGCNITFQASSSSWWGIKFEDSSNDDECILEYCTIKDASYGVYCSHASPDIKNCTIRDNLFGIYGYYTNYQQVIRDNEFQDNTYYGILLSHSSPKIEGNEILSGATTAGIRADYSSGDICNNIIKNLPNNGISLFQSSPVIYDNKISNNSSNGVYCGNNTTAYFQQGYDTYRGNNVIDNNGQNGVKIDSNSSPDLSSDDPYHPAENSLYMNVGKEVYSESSYEIIATYNWWGQYPPNSSQFYGDVDYSHALNSDPNQSTPTLAKGWRQGNSEIKSEDISAGPKDAIERFEKGRSYERVKKYSEAINEYQYVVDNYPETRVAVSSLVRLRQCYEKSGKSEEGSNYYQVVAKDNTTLEIGGKASEFQAIDLIEDGSYDDAISYYASIRNNFPELELGIQALFEKWQIYFNLKRDEKAAKATMEEYANAYPDDEWVVFMKVAAGEIKRENAPKQNETVEKSLPDTTSAANTYPESFAMFDNYPNPFNPQTSIRYALPQSGHVLIEIYNVLGQRIATLIVTEMAQGYHVAKWDGRNSLGQKVGAGIYLVRMQAGSFAKTQKMMLLP